MIPITPPPQQQPQRRHPPLRASTPQILPSPLLASIFSHLDTPSLFTAALTCKHWRSTIFLCKSHSPQLLRPHLATLRAHFGRETVPHRIPIPTVEKLLTQYARETVPAYAFSRETYTLPSSPSSSSLISADSARVAVSAGRKTCVYDVLCSPIARTHVIQIPDRVSQVAVEGGYLALAAKGKLYLYALLAGGMTLRLYAVPMSGVAGIAVGRCERTEEPLVAVVSKDKTTVVHPSYALWRRRSNFFKGGGVGEECPWVITYPVGGTSVIFKNDGRGIVVGNSLLGVWDGEERSLASTWKGFARRLVMKVDGDGVVCVGGLVGVIDGTKLTVEVRGGNPRQVRGGRAYAGCSQGRTAFLAFSRGPGKLSVLPVGEGEEREISISGVSGGGNVLSVTGSKEHIIVSMPGKIVVLRLWQYGPDSRMKIGKDGRISHGNKHEGCVIQ